MLALGVGIGAYLTHQPATRAAIPPVPPSAATFAQPAVRTYTFICQPSPGAAGYVETVTAGQQAVCANGATPVLEH